jgi:type VI secretion system protein ImpH
MAGASGTASDRLTSRDGVTPFGGVGPSKSPERSEGLARSDGPALLALLGAEPARFSLFAALRLLEQAFSGHARLGEARKAADEPVRLGQAPSLAFAPSEVSAFAAGGERPPRLEQYAFGVFGPNGALPLHLTEQAYEGRRHREDSTFVDFLNTFQHRLISLFYRAWANADPATSLDRPASDRFSVYVGALVGLAPESARARDAAPDYAKLHRAGHFAPHVRSAEGLQRILGDYFHLPVEVRQFVGDWMDVPAEAYCRLGAGESVAGLGQTATLGAASWQCQHKFEIALGPLSRAAFNDFLPGSRGVEELYALVRLYTNDEWTWQLRLLLAQVEVPGVWLGGQAQLGWTTWLGGRRATVDDVVLQEPMLRMSAAHRPKSDRARTNTKN